MHISRLSPTAPYNFHLSAMIFSGGDPQIRMYDRGVFRQVLNIEGILVLVEVSSRGTTDTPELYFTIQPEGDISASLRTATGILISSMLNIDEDLTPFYHAMQGDPVMSSLTRQLRGVKSPVTPTVFEALVDSVIEQQISLKAAHSIERRLIRATGSKRTISESVYYCYPVPGTLAKATDATFRACGLTRRKGEYIRGISQDIVSGALDLESLRRYTDTESIIGKLTEIRGVGRWTAELTILRGLHRPDAFPADDVGVRRFIGQFYLNDIPVSSAQARVFAERWGIWKGVAAYYLEIADLLGIIPSGNNGLHQR